MNYYLTCDQLITEDNPLEIGEESYGKFYPTAMVTMKLVDNGLVDSIVIINSANKRMSVGKFLTETSKLEVAKDATMEEYIDDYLDPHIQELEDELVKEQELKTK